MRSPLALILAFSVVSTISALVHQSQAPNDTGSLGIENVSQYNPLQSRAVDVRAEWDKALCKGAKLHQAMLKSEAQAASFVTPVRSPWDGDLVAEFRTWGYREIPGYRADLCDFGKDMHVLQRAFGEMGINTLSSADGGPNTCYHIEHKYGPTVEPDQNGQWPDPSNQYYTAGGRRMRVTQAWTTLGINPDAGALYFLNRASPRQSAHEEWDVPLNQIQTQQLPDLASSSDHAWGFWTRAHAGGNTANINKIFTCMITNDITVALIAEAIRTYPLPPGTHPDDRPRGVERWPGVTFDMDLDAAKVLLGSPNGQAAGYFLAQHKHRFGRSKTISKVQVFRPDKGMMPYLLFWVVDAPPLALTAAKQTEQLHEGGGMSNTLTSESHMFKRSVNGNSVIREHVFRAKLS